MHIYQPPGWEYTSYKKICTHQGGSTPLSPLSFSLSLPLSHTRARARVPTHTRTQHVCTHTHTHKQHARARTHTHKYGHMLWEIILKFKVNGQWTWSGRWVMCPTCKFQPKICLQITAKPQKISLKTEHISSTSTEDHWKQCTWLLFTDILTGTYFSFSPHTQTQQLHLFSRYYLCIIGNKQYMSKMKGVIKYHHPITMPFSLEQILLIL
jgi:hypothetical protein